MTTPEPQAPAAHDTASSAVSRPLANARGGPPPGGRRAGRPSRSGREPITAVDRRTGRALAWADGEFSGDDTAVALARGLCLVGAEVQLRSPHPVGPVRRAEADDSAAVVAVIGTALVGDLDWTGVPSTLEASTSASGCVSEAGATPLPAQTLERLGPALWAWAAARYDGE